MEGKGSFVILLSIVAFLSLALAVLAGYVFFVGGSSQKPATEATQKESTKKLAEADLLPETLVTKQYFNLKSTNANKLSVLQIEQMKVIFYKGKLAEEPAKKLFEPYLSKMKEEVSTYFSEITIEEAQNQKETKEKAKKELLAKFNEIVPADEKTKQKQVIEINIEVWFAQ